MVQSQFKRSTRVGQMVQHELAQLLIDGVKDPRVGFVTVTEVKVADDLRSAHVFVSIYGDAQQRSDGLAGLRASAGYLRRELGHRIQLKFTPNLNFELDESLDQVERFENIFNAIADGEHEVPEDRSAEIVPVHTARSGLPEPVEIARPKRVPADRSLRRRNKPARPKRR